MTRSDDDSSVRRHLSDRQADALLRGPELAGLVADLRSMATEVPPPSAALAAMLAQGVVPAATATMVLPTPRRRHRWLVALPLTGLLLGGTLGAASANVLPDGAQRVVSDTVSSITPIHLPKPAEKPRPTPAPTAQLSPAETAPPSEDPKPSPHPTARPTGSPEIGDDGRDDGTGARDDSSTPRPSRTPERNDDGRAPTPAPGGDGEEHDGGSHDGGGGDHSGSGQGG